MIRLKPFVSGILFLLAGLFIAVSFQNCGGIAAMQNGNGYGGLKSDPPPGAPSAAPPNSNINILRYIEAGTETCTNGSGLAHAEIDNVNGVYILVHEGCVPVDPPVQVEVSLGPTNTTILYNGRTFTLVPAGGH